MKELTKDTIKLVISIIKLLISLLVLVCMIISIVASIKELITGSNIITFISPVYMDIVNIVSGVAIIFVLGDIIFKSVKKLKKI